MAPNDRPRQLPLAFKHQPGFARDDLIVSSANRDTVALIERWPAWPSSLVVLVGPPDSGKSHLGAIWRERADAVEAKSVALGALAGRSPWPSLFVDDADSPDLDENALFHALNAAREAETHVLLTARRPPAAWSVKLPDLGSRLMAATTTEIGAPDDLLLRGVIAKLFADRQIQIDSTVLQFLVRRMERSLSQAGLLVERLDRLGLERQARITRALAAELFDGQRDDDRDD